ncbi:hypothetical protein TSAR_006968 [Trichomalopsis sarcophagae]|uniref:Single domain-containing protein n=1 Tax=Trichomalopsis sarcophagae TaxID=543379 RepID=A0A232FCF1_9HYME|nr:hypothetical protein TSAR_006968 [Trichomalopsis sarcophagae]
MKYFAIFCLIAASTFTAVKSKSVNIKIDTKEAELKEEYCDFPKYSPFKRECALFKCSEDRTRVLAIPCPYSPCPAKLNSGQDKFSKPYPECCAPLVCN